MPATSVFQMVFHTHYHCSGKRLFIFVSLWLLIFLFRALPAQVENQVQGTYQMYYSLKERVRLEGEVGSWSNVENKDWSVFYLKPGFQYWLRPYLNLIGMMDFRYTWQRILDNLFEVRPWVGGRLLWPTFRDFSLDHLVRAEMRIVSYRGSQKEDDFDTAARLRYQLQLKTPNYGFSFLKGLIYGLISYEIFLNLGETVEERFINSNRLRLGLGYRLNRQFMFEFLYTRQKSRNYITENFREDQNVWQLKIKHFWRLSS